MYIKVLKNRITIISEALKNTEGDYSGVSKTTVYLKTNNLGRHILIDEKTGFHSRDEMLKKYKILTLKQCEQIALELDK